MVELGRQSKLAVLVSVEGQVPCSLAPNSLQSIIWNSMIDKPWVRYLKEQFSCPRCISGTVTIELSPRTGKNFFQLLFSIREH